MAWAEANDDKLRYQGCRICDLGVDWRDAMNQLYDRGFRRLNLSEYLRSGGIDPSWLSDNTMTRHFRGGPEHGRP